MPTVMEVPDQRIVMPDGVRLSARMWRPAGVGPVPAIVEMIPYRKRDGTAARDEAIHPFIAERGYACLRVDLRGSGDSEGVLTDEYTPQELADACAVIAWVAAQGWCTGAVGMMGKSWGAFNALQVAALQPPALKAVIAVCGTVDRFGEDIHFKGGCLLGENFGWASVMLSYSSRPADPALRADWREDWLARLDENPWLAPRWAGHQTRDAYWRHGSVCEDWSRLTVPILAIGGWADGYMNMVGALVRNAAGPVKGIVGPWVHLYPHMAVPGPRIGFLTEALRWWDRWLKDKETGVEADPALRLLLQDADMPDPSAQSRTGRWISLPARPAVATLTLALGPGGIGPEVRLPARVATSQTLGAAAGEYFPTGNHSEMAGDQAADDALSLRFDGLPVTKAMVLVGRANLRLTVVSDQPTDFVVARLCDVAPDGTSTRIAHGMLNLCHRAGSADPKMLEPGQPVQVMLTLDAMAHRLAPGHRLRLALSNSYWPFLWPSAHAGVLTVTAGALGLPILPEAAPDWQPPDPEPLPFPRQRTQRPGAWSRQTVVDPATGRQTLTIIEDIGDTVEPHGLTHGETMEERWEITPDDPLSARATTRWEQRLSRGDWQVRTLVETEMTATETYLRMQARLTAWEGEAQVFQRDWDDLVPRRFV
jgi:putative CocE/NonD family hydrolase